jgi:uncharacterized protein (DUF983 family)
VNEAPAASSARGTTSLVLWIVGSIVVFLFVVAPALGLLLLWAWGKAGSE